MKPRFRFTTLPKTNIGPENTPLQKETSIEFAGAMLVSRRVNEDFFTKACTPFE